MNVFLFLAVFFFVFFCYKNAELAQKKGQNTLLWGFITATSFSVTAFISAFVVSVIVQFKSIATTSSKAMISDYPNTFGKPTVLFTIYFIGIGGYLVVRYILERMPDKKEEN